jgi:hypothetical protein
LSIIDDLESRLSALERERDTLWRENFNLFPKLLKDGYPFATEGTEAQRTYDANTKRIDEIDDEFLRLEAKRDDKIRREKERFHRPTGWLGSLISKGLPPLPEYDKLIQPTKQNLARVRSYRFVAVLIVSVAALSLLLSVWFAPWLLISPGSLLIDGMELLFGKVWGGIIGIGVIMAVLMFMGGLKSNNRYKGSFIDSAAMFEEQWFRMGAEHWSRGQRAYSTVMFGLVHVANIVYPIAGLLVVGFGGWVFMAVYLKAYRETGSTELATITSAKLHATYNRLAIAYMLIAVSVSLAYSMFGLFQ